MAEKEYIEREALIDFCKKIIHDRWNETTAPVSWSHAYADFIDDINNQPAADVAPVKRGFWKPISESEITGFNPKFAGRDPIAGYKCSNCGNEAIFSCNDEFVLSDYCPNCGARMDGDDGETD